MAFAQFALGGAALRRLAGQAQMSVVQFLGAGEVALDVAARLLAARTAAGKAPRRPGKAGQAAQQAQVLQVEPAFRISHPEHAGRFAVEAPWQQQHLGRRRPGGAQRREQACRIAQQHRLAARRAPVDTACMLVREPRAGGAAAAQRAQHFFHPAGYPFRMQRQFLREPGQRPVLGGKVRRAGRPRGQLVCHHQVVEIGHCLRMREVTHRLDCQYVSIAGRTGYAKTPAHANSVPLGIQSLPCCSSAGNALCSPFSHVRRFARASCDALPYRSGSRK